MGIESLLAKIVMSSHNVEKMVGRQRTETPRME
jgi:hypothetical protein